MDIPVSIVKIEPFPLVLDRPVAQIEASMVSMDEEMLPSLVEKSTVSEINKLSIHGGKDSEVSGVEKTLNSGGATRVQWSCNKCRLFFSSFVELHMHVGKEHISKVVSAQSFTNTSKDHQKANSFAIKNNSLEKLGSESNFECNVQLQRFTGMSDVLQNPCVKNKTIGMNECYSMQLEKYLALKHLEGENFYRKTSASTSTDIEKKPKYYLVNLLRKRLMSKRRSPNHVKKAENENHNICSNFELKHSKETQNENSLSCQKDVGFPVNITEDPMISLSPELSVNVSDTTPPSGNIHNVEKNQNDTSIEVKVETAMISECNSSNIHDPETICTNIKVELEDSNTDNSDIKIKEEEAETIIESNSMISLAVCDDNSQNCREFKLYSNNDVEIKTDTDVMKEIYQEMESSSASVTEIGVLYAVSEEGIILSSKDCLITKDTSTVDSNSMDNDRPLTISTSIDTLSDEDYLVTRDTSTIDTNAVDTNISLNSNTSMGNVSDIDCCITVNTHKHPSSDAIIDTKSCWSFNCTLSSELMKSPVVVFDHFSKTSQNFDCATNSSTNIDQEGDVSNSEVSPLQPKVNEILNTGSKQGRIDIEDIDMAHSVNTPQSQIKENETAQIVKMSPMICNHVKPFKLNYMTKKKEKQTLTSGEKIIKTNSHFCTNCDLTFSSKFEFLKHQDVCRIITKTEMPKGMMYCCKLCHAGFKFQRHLLRHVQRHVSEDSYESQKLHNLTLQSATRDKLRKMSSDRIQNAGSKPPKFKISESYDVNRNGNSSLILSKKKLFTKVKALKKVKHGRSRSNYYDKSQDCSVKSNSLDCNIKTRSQKINNVGAQVCISDLGSDYQGIKHHLPECRVKLEKLSKRKQNAILKPSKTINHSRPSLKHCDKNQDYSITTNSLDQIKTNYQKVNAVQACIADQGQGSAHQGIKYCLPECKVELEKIHVCTYCFQHFKRVSDLIIHLEKPHQ